MIAGTALAIPARDAFSQNQVPTPREWTPNWISGEPNASQAGFRKIALQPLAQQVRELESTLEFLDEPFSPSERDRINQSLARPRRFDTCA
jgi:hypothetical protein